VSALGELPPARAVTDGTIAAMNLESARRGKWARFIRCGTYGRIRAAIKQAAGVVPLAAKGD
jgi:hypothetical protein